MDFSNVVVIVTGASSGLGSILSEILTGVGATVIGTYHSNKKNSPYEMIKCDITNENEVKGLFLDVKEKYNKIDAVINCAAYTCDNPYQDKTYDEFMSVVSVNLGGTYLINKYASLNMDKGVVINISSTDGIDTFNGLNMDYSASKAGVINLTKNFAKENKKLKICALCPGFIDTQAVLDMDPHFLEKELKRCNQKKLLKKENVAMKIIEMIVNNDNYVSGDIVRMDEDE